ncbi:MAG: hypothetical protein ISS47_08485 [Candidatus Omnitrophica bacterium]|nr:hypothetical protein [Candidatus Omnitrophota bacterium]
MGDKDKKDISSKIEKGGYQPKKDQILQEGYKPKPASNVEDSSQCAPPQGGSGAEESKK